MNKEDFRDAIIADIIIEIESMSHDLIVRELINLKTNSVLSMTSSQLMAFRKKQVEKFSQHEPVK
ncbi:MAG: hypothetical protein UT84_C0012G0014 [Candidatus Curtissbacteria bacterium GW2011_GWA1_40_16]|uniref:Uncharacterized protein n=1 Tax=Candidatus Curtissbacteria bacterium GW2011_GWA1_40_16 TaxID=1618405 RepID=A0A0G0RKA4_9BACT|nr:MAG: hypothetical protein UT84_C0012G0014 [Candidatus Curtissbacteria bacterium GW2011_GWA1_40_16]